MYKVPCRTCDAVVERQRNRKTARCHECDLAYHRQHYRDNRQKYIDKARAWNLKMKQELLDHYGSECACCCESEPMFLELDHVNGGGTTHRKEVGGGSRFWGWIKRNNFPEEYQILCSNCNSGKHRNGGICPHNN